MKKNKHLMVILGLLILTFTSCKKDETSVPENNNPLYNGSLERNMIIVISDLHLGADLAYSETNNNLNLLEQFLNQIKTSPNVKELVSGGDLLDEWFVPANVDTYNGRDQSDFVKQIASTNKRVIDVFNSII